MHRRSPPTLRTAWSPTPDPRGDRTTAGRRAFIAATAALCAAAPAHAQPTVPTVYVHSEFARAGGLASYGAELFDLHRRAASHVARILRGASPAELPVEQPMRFEVMINLATARELGLNPSSAMLTDTDEVIE